MRRTLLPLLLFSALALAADPVVRTFPDRPVVAEEALTSTEAGARIHRLAEGTGRAAATGDTVKVDVTIWAADGKLLDTSTLRDRPEVIVPGAGTHHAAIETALLGAQAGERRLARFALAEGQPPVDALLEVREVKKGRFPPPGPQKIAAERYTTTASGLRYVDLEVGTGEPVRTGKQVVVDYTGWLTDGTRFDSSLTRPTPFSFKLGYGQVIRGWDEGVAGMRIGGSRQLVVPAAIAYGARGQPPTIPPGADLVFEVTLLEVR